MKETKTPDPISFSDPIFDFNFHPTRNLVVAGLITGYLSCYQYTDDANTLQWSTQISKKSCRGIEFNHDGALIMTISRDKSIQTIDTSTGRIISKIPKAHRYPINKIHALDLNRIATGDDEGVIKIWDMRSPKVVQHYTTCHDDFIADMTFTEEKSTLVVAGGDGVLSIHDTRQLDKSVITCSLDDELLTVTTVKNDGQVVAGSQSGALYFWQWGNWVTFKDRWLGHPSSVDTLCKLDEETICTGGNDGLLRLVSVSPKYAFEGVLGDHGEDFPVERVRFSCRQQATGGEEGPSSSSYLLGSCGHDLSLRFWDLGYLFDPDSQEEENDEYQNDGNEKDDGNDQDEDDGNENCSTFMDKNDSKGHTKRLKHEQDFFLDL